MWGSCQVSHLDREMETWEGKTAYRLQIVVCGTIIIQGRMQSGHQHDAGVADKENWKGSSIWSETQHKVPPRALDKAPTPKLCLGEFQKPLYLDFRSVHVGAAKTLKFALELLPEATETRVGHGAVTLQVDRAPKSVEVSGVV